jgi:dTDP-4-amino-4,6-dideoxy-D-glucose acyltransferase
MYNIKKISSYGEDIFISNNVEIKHPHLFKIGSHIAIDSGFYITTSAQLGDYIHIGPHVCVIGGKTAQLIMGNFTNIAAGCKIICGSDRFGGDGFSFPTLQPPFRDTLIIKPVIIEDFSGIGWRNNQTRFSSWCWVGCYKKH